MNAETKDRISALECERDSLLLEYARASKSLEAELAHREAIQYLFNNCEIAIPGLDLFEQTKEALERMVANETLTVIGQQNCDAEFTELKRQRDVARAQASESKRAMDEAKAHWRLSSVCRTQEAILRDLLQGARGAIEDMGWLASQIEDDVLKAKARAIEDAVFLLVKQAEDQWIGR